MRGPKYKNVVINLQYCTRIMLAQTKFIGKRDGVTWFLWKTVRKL